MAALEARSAAAGPGPRLGIGQTRTRRLDFTE
jgi:hypothetical protein